MKTILLILFMWFPLSSNQQPVSIDTINPVDPPSKKTLRYSSVVEMQSEIKDIALRQDSALQILSKRDPEIKRYINSDEYIRFLASLEE